MKIPTYYSERYAAQTHTISMRKLPIIASAVNKEQLVELTEPKRVNSIGSKLERLHDEAYVQAFLAGKEPLASSSGFGWTKEIRDGVLESNAGTLEAAEFLMAAEKKPAHRVAASISQGFHHAGYLRGEGYCTFNGLALIAQELPDKKIFVLDLDLHEGNGTTEFCQYLPNLYNYSIYGADFGGKKNVKHSTVRQVSSWVEAEAALMDAFVNIMEVQPDLIVYQAGMDAFAGDPMGGYLTKTELQERDRTVFQFAKDVNIPIMFCVAGGYGAEAVENHTETWRQAYKVWNEIE